MFRRTLFGIASVLLLSLSLKAQSAAPGPSPTGRGTQIDLQQQELKGIAHLLLMTPGDVKVLKANAASGNPTAQFWLGMAYREGKLVPKNEAEASRWWLKSAEQGYVPAERAYGSMLLAKDSPAAETWLLRAAEQGDADAQLWLGVGYEKNSFGTTDIDKEMKWYRRAAEGGSPDAQVVLGQKYQDGEDVDQSYELAAKWFRMAAEHVPDLGGAGQGRYRLGLLFMQGLGVPQDYVQAYFWFCLDDPNGANAASAKAHLLPAQVNGVERLIKVWKQQHPLDPEVAKAFHIDN